MEKLYMPQAFHSFFLLQRNLADHTLTGTPIVKNLSEDNKKDPLAINAFDYTGVLPNFCPLGAQIRKTNPRDLSDIMRNARIIRNDPVR